MVQWQLASRGRSTRQVYDQRKSVKKARLEAQRKFRETPEGRAYFNEKIKKVYAERRGELRKKSAEHYTANKKVIQKRRKYRAAYKKRGASPQPMHRWRSRARL